MSREFRVFGKTFDAVREDALAKGAVGHLVLLKWPPLHDSSAWERLRKLRTGELTTFAARTFPDRIEVTKTYEDFIERYFRFVDNAADYDSSETIHAFSATTRACKNCSSQIAVERVVGELCPVCGADLRSKTVQATIERWHERIGKQQASGEEHAVRAGWLGAWAALTYVPTGMEDSEELARTARLRRFDSEAHEASQSGDISVPLPHGLYERLLEQSSEQEKDVASYLSDLLDHS